MFARLGHLTHRRRAWVLGAALLLTALAVVFGPGVSEQVKNGGFTDRGSESFAADAALQDAYGRTAGDVVVVWEHPELEATDPAFAAEITGLLAALPSDAVARVVDPWTAGLPEETRAALLGTDGHSAMALISLTGADDEERQLAYEQISGALAAAEPWRTDVAGSVPVNNEMQQMSEDDISRAELVAMPVLLVLMILIFGSVVAAILPATIGGLAILGTMALLRGITLVTDVSTFALNVTTILGLGLAIDYSLFMVSRFREELAKTDDVATAVTRTVATAGRTVAFSGLTVLIAFAGLLFFPQMFLRSMGLGGMAVVLLDVLLALTLLPALLSLLGRRVDAGRLPAGVLGTVTRRALRGRTRPESRRRTEGGWARLARALLRRPAVVALGATALLALLALPALDLRTGQTDARDLPPDSETREALDRIEDAFPTSQDTQLDLVADATLTTGALEAWTAELAAVPGVTGVRLAAEPQGVTYVAVTTAGEVDAPATQDLVAELRALDPPEGADEVLVGGAAAQNVDNLDALIDTLPITLGFVAGVTLLLLFAALGSVVLPLKAVLMNVLSIGATVGVLVWAFGQGHLSGLLGFTETGRIDPSNLVLIALGSFGLAMDYELFLLSRIREEHLRGADTTTSIANGLQRSGRTITSAALLLVVVLAAMGTSGLTFLKLIGLGLAFAVAVDATVVRALLVPATMKLLGRANWWLPAPLARLHRWIALRDGEDELHPVPAPARAGELTRTPA